MQKESKRADSVEKGDTKMMGTSQTLDMTKMVQTKSKGLKEHQPVTQFPFSECAWTFSGSFTIIFLLSFLSSNITLWNTHGHAFPLGKAFFSFEIYLFVRAHWQVISTNLHQNLFSFECLFVLKIIAYHRLLSILHIFSSYSYVISFHSLVQLYASVTFF